VNDEVEQLEAAYVNVRSRYTRYLEQFTTFHKLCFIVTVVLYWCIPHQLSWLPVLLMGISLVLERYTFSTRESQATKALRSIAADKEAGLLLVDSNVAERADAAYKALPIPARVAIAVLPWVRGAGVLSIPLVVWCE
jgi:vacuolar-type H+-ATPase subunit F/Vma7